MPRVSLIYFVEDDRSTPFLDWLDGLPARSQLRCVAKLVLLEQYGHELRRPHAEYIEGTDLYELRVKVDRVNLRILYFFHERAFIVVSHGFAKEGKLPRREVDLAIQRLRSFRANPVWHTSRPEQGDGREAD